MARSNDTQDFSKVITPLTNIRWFQCALFLKSGQESLKCKQYFGLTPERAVFPDDKSYNTALGIFEANMVDFNKAKSNGLRAVEVFSKATGGHIGYDYEVDLTNKEKLEKTGNVTQSISGHLVNFYPHPQDTLPNGEVKGYWVAELVDFKANEKYTLKMSSARYGRELIDKICSLTPKQLQFPIEISLNLFEAYGKDCVNTTLIVKDTNIYGTKIEPFYENSIWDDKLKKYLLKPKGQDDDNKEFIVAFEHSLAKQFDISKPLLDTFYNRIALSFQQEVLIPTMVIFFKAMGWNMEIQNRDGEKEVKQGRKKEKITEKIREVIFLTPIEEKIIEEAPNNNDVPSLEEELPF